MSHILVDMDGVIADWTQGIIDFLRDNDRDAVIDTGSWNLTRPGDEQSLAQVRWAQRQSGFYSTLYPYPGAAEALNEMIAEGYTVTICSTPDATNATCASDKIAWLEEYIGEGWGKRLVLTHDKTIVNGDILIDDKPDITGMIPPVWKQVLFDQPYNRRIKSKRRMYHWHRSQWLAAVDPSTLPTGSRALA